MSWDFRITNHLNKNLLPGKIYVDIGANKGIYTNIFSDFAGKDGKVYSFEIYEPALKILRLNKKSNVIIEKLAIGLKSEEVDVFQDGYMYNIIGKSTNGSPSHNIGKIEVTSLDEYFKHIKVDYIKMDIEGSELDAIKGGINTIRNCSYCIIETHFDEDWFEMYELLKSNNLKFYNLMDDKEIYYGDTVKSEGISSNGRPYQIYMKTI